MSQPPHHFLPGLTSPQQSLRNQFSGSMQNQLGNTMQSQMNNQLSNQMSGQMGSQIGNSMIGQMSNALTNPMANTMTTMSGQINNALGNQLNGMSSSSQMMSQINTQYSIANNTQVTNQTPSPMQHGMALQHSGIQSQSQQVIQTSTNVAPTPTPPAQSQPQQSKEFNTASLCRIGQETVQDIVSRTQEVFQTLKAIQPPNGTSQGTNASNEKKVKVQEQLRTIRVLFKRLRLIYEKCNENCQIQGMEYTHIESLIPFKDEVDAKHDEKKNTESYREACEESKEVMEQVVLKNKQLKEVIDHLRRIIWEINTMLSMRRS